MTRLDEFHAYEVAVSPEDRARVIEKMFPGRCKGPPHG